MGQISPSRAVVIEKIADGVKLEAELFEPPFQAGLHHGVPINHPLVSAHANRRGYQAEYRVGQRAPFAGSRRR